MGCLCSDTLWGHLSAWILETCQYLGQISSISRISYRYLHVSTDLIGESDLTIHFEGVYLEKRSVVDHPGLIVVQIVSPIQRLGLSGLGHTMVAYDDDIRSLFKSSVSNTRYQYVDCIIHSCNGRFDLFRVWTKRMTGNINVLKVQGDKSWSCRRA